MDEVVETFKELIEFYEAGYVMSKALGLGDPEIEDLIKKAKEGIQYLLTLPKDK